MSLLSRLNDVLSSNFNALLDRIEDPERMLQYVIVQMEEALCEAQRHAARAIAAERRLRREMDAQQAEVERWQARARLAAKANRDDLARRALTRKLEHADIAARLRLQHSEAAQANDELRSALQSLRARIAEARQRQRLASARRQASRARFEVERALGATSLDITGALAKFERLENRLFDDNEELAAHIEIMQLGSGSHEEVHDLETKQRLDEELRLLKEN